MVKIYVDLIKKGLKTINDVPASIRKAVAKALKEN
ncbi:MAG: CD1375 family protein [Oscillospiraceae bacterium]|nr:CD1375 family protein [Oscillospiraceae bacterium]